jgi:hypothetical protein
VGPRARRVRSGALLAAGVALGIVVVLAQVVRIGEPLGVDQGLFACFTRWVPRGWLPYRDLFDSKPPLFLYWYALAALVPGEVTRAIWIVEGVWLAATLAVAYAVAAKLWSRGAGIACAALLFVGSWSPSWGGFWSRAQAEEILALPMILAAWLAWRSAQRASYAAWAGALAGICGLFKIPSMAIVGAFVVTWALTMPPRSAARRTALLACGLAMPWLVLSAWFAAHHALGDFIDGILVYHRYNAAFIAPPWDDVLRDFGQTMIQRASLPLFAAAVGLVAMNQRGARELAWVVPWIGFTMAAIVLQRQLAPYHYLLAMPALAFAGGYGVWAAAQALTGAGLGVRALASASLLAIMLLGVREGSAWVEAYTPDAELVAGRTPRATYLRATQRGNYSTADEEAAAAYVHDRTAPADGILVWALSPGLYALADRHPVTRYPFHKILMTEAPLSRMWPGLDDRRRKFMARLRADPPAYILVGHADRNGFEPQDSFTSMTRFPELNELVQRDYRWETEIGHLVLFHREPRGP